MPIYKLPFEKSSIVVLVVGVKVTRLSKNAYVHKLRKYNKNVHCERNGISSWRMTEVSSCSCCDIILSNSSLYSDLLISLNKVLHLRLNVSLVIIKIRWVVV